MMLSTIPTIQKAFILILDDAKNLVGTDKLIFSAMPQIGNDSVSVSWNTQSIPMNTQPIVFWQHTSERSLSLSVRFVAWDSFQRDVKEKVDWCRSLCYPVEALKGARAKYTTEQITELKKSEKSDAGVGGVYGLSFTPPLVRVVIGKLIDFRGRVNSFNVSWNTDAIDIKTLIPVSADVSLSLAAVNETRLLRDMVVKGNYR